MSANAEQIQLYDLPPAKCCQRCLEEKKNYDSSVPHLCDDCVSTLETDDERPSVSLVNFDHVAVERVQLLNAFLSSHYSATGKTEIDLARYTSLFMDLPDVNLSSRMLSAAVDTLCLAYLGTHHNDRRLLMASQNSYGCVLGQIMRAVDGKTKATPCEVIASCLLMSVYNDGSSPRGDLARNYATHLFGAAQYAQVFGPGCLDPRRPFDRKLLMWIRFQTLFVCAAKRKKFFWEEKRWRALDEMLQKGGNRNWFPLLVPLPGLLEQSDEFLRGTSSKIQGNDVAQLCEKLDTYRRQLLDWVENDFAGHTGIAAVTDWSKFDMEIEEHCFLTSATPTFTTFHVFADAGHAMRCLSTWALAIISDCTLLRLIRMYPGIAATAKWWNFEEIERIAYRSASDICKSVYYYSTLHSSAYAHVLYVFVDLARTIFEECGAINEVGWCQACLIAVKLRMARLHSERGGGTLCRVGDLLGRFEDACRYRSGGINLHRDDDYV